MLRIGLTSRLWNWKQMRWELLNRIVQKILLAPKFEEDNQCNKIFRIYGTINDKVYKMIIDSGSSENTDSMALVKAIG